MLFKNGRYANVASTLALVVALGGTSYAAVAIPKNSVGSKQIINSSVKSKDVKNGTLRAKDFRAGQLPAGAQGPAGPAGPTGPTGPMGPSNAYAIDSANNILDWNGAEQTVATLNLPSAGNYVLFAKVLGNNNTAAVASLNCKLRLGATILDSGFDVVDVDSAGADLDRAYIPLGGAGTAAAATTATVTCTSTQPNGNWLNRVITAVKVGSIN